ncbi:unnamed protein product [Agarophyton chilense]
MVRNIRLTLLLAVIVVLSATAASARIPGLKASRQRRFSQTNEVLKEIGRDAGQIKAHSGHENPVPLSNWPDKPLKDICEPVIKCMCKVVPAEFKTLEMLEACKFEGVIADDVCFSTDEAKCFHSWWLGQHIRSCDNLARDCVPYMFYHLDWEVASR